MSVTIQLRQVTSVVDGPLYRVKNTVEKASGISSALFVFKTITQKFDHYATVADLENYPDNYDDAQSEGSTFYRLPEVIRDWDTIDDMLEDMRVTKQRLQAVVNDVTRLNGELPSDTTTTITGEV